MPAATPVLFLNGSYGVGKTSALDHFGDVLAERGIPFSLMDVDWFHRSWPPADDDPHNVLAEASNMAAVWRTYRRAGPRRLVVAGVIEHPHDRLRYETALEAPLRSIRLTASARVAEQRLRRRYSADQGRALDWHLQRHVALAESLDRSGLDEFVVDTSERTPREVAEAVLQLAAL